MGTIIHNFINVAIHGRSRLESITSKLRILGLEYSTFEGSNEYNFLTIFPTGSKVGFNRYCKYKENLEKIKQIFKLDSVEWVEVEFGETSTKIVDGDQYERVD